jgi:peptidyl-tRNA hydrolase (EC 3.1.1.29)
MSDAWLIAGLGNPGNKYAYNWHNLGFLALDMLADRNNVRIERKQFHALFGKGKIGGHEVFLMKPQTYMNNSGESVGPFANYYKIDPSHIIIVYDDIDIATGTIRVRGKGSAGTHNGMKSVIAHLGTEAFPRVRIGSGPVPEHMDLVSYVLADVPREQRRTVFDSFEEACTACEDIVNGKRDL